MVADGDHVVHLFRRVPNVLKNVGKLVYVVRVKGR